MEAILVPLDFSNGTAKVVSTAVKFAELLKTRLVLLHVVEPKDAYTPLDSTDILAIPSSAMRPVDAQAFMSRLEDLATPLRQHNHLEVLCKVQAGLAVEEILAQAWACGCGLILMGSHGHGALYDFFTGGVATGVLKKAQVPVLVVPVREHSTRGKNAAQTANALRH